MRLLLKLYPRRVRNRYGDELLDLQGELTARGDVSRTRLIWDMLARALLVRPARHRARLLIGAVLVVVGLAIAAPVTGGRATGSPARASRARVRLAVKRFNAVPYGSCFVAASSCSLTPAPNSPVDSRPASAVAQSVPGTRRRPRVTETGCVAYPRVRPLRPVFVGE
jgi:hypothetical protein